MSARGQATVELVAAAVALMIAALALFQVLAAGRMAAIADGAAEAAAIAVVNGRDPEPRPAPRHPAGRVTACACTSGRDG